jgi:hypothetical protein
MVRDTALFAAGLLVPRLGGPAVSPYQPGDLWTEANSMSPAYRQGVGEDLHRRSLYTVWKRTAPMPNMTLFDAPSREVCTAARQRTATPLQALVLLNDVQFVEAARVLAEEAVRRHGGDAAARIEFVFRRLCTRVPTAAEAALLAGLLETRRAVYAAEPDAARALLAQGATPADCALDAVEVAATTAVAQAVLNLDATLVKR